MQSFPKQSFVFPYKSKQKIKRFGFTLSKYSYKIEAIKIQESKIYEYYVFLC